MCAACKTDRQCIALQLHELLLKTKEHLGLARGGQQASGGFVSQEEEEVAGHLPGEGRGEATEHARHPVLSQNLSKISALLEVALRWPTVLWCIHRLGGGLSTTSYSHLI